MGREEKMLKYCQNKLHHAILYFAKEHHKRAKKYPTILQIFKYLAFLDFELVRETGRPAFGLKYKAMKYGPVPDELYKLWSKNKVIDEEFYKVVENQADSKKYVIPKAGKEPDLKMFSQRERAVMEKLLTIYADRFVEVFDFSEASHEVIKSWQKAFQTKPNSFIDFRDEILLNEKDPIEREIKLERLETYLELSNS